MDPVQTLHDFTLNLLNDSAAREAFGADPERVLSAAGLGDVSATDVHEVIPLVLDYAPVGNLDGLNGLDGLGGLGELSRADQGLGLPQDGPLSAIQQLQALTQNLGGVSDLPTQTDLSNTAASVTAISQDLTGGFSPSADLSRGLDSSVVDHATSALNGVAAGNAPQVGDVAGQVGDLTSAVQGGDVAGAVTAPVAGAADLGSHIGDLSNVIGGAADFNFKHVGGDLTQGVENHLGGVEHQVEHNTAVHEVTSHVGDVANNVASGTDVHDVVSHVGNGIGNGADLGHLDTGDIGSNNDLHLSF